MRVVIVKDGRMLGPDDRRMSGVCGGDGQEYCLGHRAVDQAPTQEIGREEAERGQMRCVVCRAALSGSSR